MASCAPFFTAAYVLPQLIADFRGMYPRVSARIIVTSQAVALGSVLEGAARLAVTSAPVDHPDMEYLPFFIDHVALIVPAGHEWERRERVRPADLLTEGLLLREEAAGTSRALMEGLSRHGIRREDLSIVMELGNAEAIEMSVEAGLGIAFVSTLTAAKGIELGRVSIVGVEGLDLRRPVVIGRSRKHISTRAQTAFLEFAREGVDQVLTSRAAVPARLAHGLSTQNGEPRAGGIAAEHTRRMMTEHDRT